MSVAVPVKVLFSVTRHTVDPVTYVGDEVFHYSLPIWHKTGDGQIETASALASGKLLLSGGEILVSKLNPEKGAVVLAKPNKLPILGSTEFVALRPKLVESHFGYWLMQSAPVRTQLNASVESVTNSHKRARVDRFLASKLVVPDLPTQKAIAEFLDRETSRIDQLIEKNRRFSSLANERWVSELNDSVFPTFPNWSHLPAEWEKVRLKYLTDPMRPIMYGIVLPGPNVEFGKLIVKGGDVKPGRLDPELLCKTTIEIESSYVRSRVKAGDLIISIRGGIGDLEVVPKTIEGANLTQDAARIAPRSGIDVEWLRYALSAPVVFHLLEAKSLGAAVRGINIFDLKRVFVPTPPSEIQTRIRDSLVAAERRLARLKELVVQHTEKIQEFRSALITASVTGQIDVSTWGKQGTADHRLDRIEGATGP